MNDYLAHSLTIYINHTRVNTDSGAHIICSEFRVTDTGQVEIVDYIDTPFQTTRHATIMQITTGHRTTTVLLTDTFEWIDMVDHGNFVTVDDKVYGCPQVFDA